MKDWGGKRKGSGRKPSELGKTIVMRVPESRVEEIKQLIKSDNAEENSSVDISEIKEILEKWDALITSDRTKQPRWENAARLLNELKTALLSK